MLTSLIRVTPQWFADSHVSDWDFWLVTGDVIKFCKQMNGTIKMTLFSIVNLLWRPVLSYIVECSLYLILNIIIFPSHLSLGKISLNDDGLAVYVIYSLPVPLTKKQKWVILFCVLKSVEFYTVLGCVCVEYRAEVLQTGYDLFMYGISVLCCILYHLQHLVSCSVFGNINKYI